MRYGTLFTVDFIGVKNRDMLNDPDELVQVMENVIVQSSLERVGQPLLHRFTPQGITYIVILAQSHLAVHTWPESGFLAVDFFSCAGPEESQRAFEALKTTIACDHIETSQVEREDTQ